MQTNKLRKFKLSVLILLQLALLVIPIYAEDLEKNNGRDILPDVIEALKKIENPLSGKGIALQKQDLNGTLKNIKLSFMFKDAMTRTDVYEKLDKDGLDERSRGWVTGPKVSVVYDGEEALITSFPTSGYAGVIGKDFHPESLLHNDFLGKSMCDVLDALNKNSTCDIKTVWHGDILDIHVSYKRGLLSENYTFSLDATKGFRPIYYMQSRGDSSSPDSNKSYSCRYKWKQYGTEFYVSSINEQIKGLSENLDAESGWATRQLVDKKTETIIQEFTPNADIDEKEFTLIGLNLAPNTVVHDKVVGVDYYLSTGIPGIDQLDAVLENAKFPNKIKLDKDSRKSVVERERDAAPYPIESRQDNVNLQSNEENKFHILIFVLLVAFILSIFVWKKRNSQ